MKGVLHTHKNILVYNIAHTFCGKRVQRERRPQRDENKLRADAQPLSTEYPWGTGMHCKSYITRFSQVLHDLLHEELAKVLQYDMSFCVVSEFHCDVADWPVRRWTERRWNGLRWRECGPHLVCRTFYTIHSTVRVQCCIDRFYDEQIGSLLTAEWDSIVWWADWSLRWSWARDWFAWAESDCWPEVHSQGSTGGRCSARSWLVSGRSMLTPANREINLQLCDTLKNLKQYGLHRQFH